MKKSSVATLALALTAGPGWLIGPSGGDGTDEPASDPRDDVDDVDDVDEAAEPRDDGDDAGLITIPVSLVPQGDAGGTERVNFGVPLPRNQLDDPGRLRIADEGSELPAYVRPIAWYDDGSLRSVQVQVEVDVSTTDELEISLGAAASGGALEPVPVEDTLVTADGTEGPRVFALLPPRWLVRSGLVGPVPSAPPEQGASPGAWAGVCDYEDYDSSRFASERGSRGSWLYDRPTALYRLHAITGDLSPLRSAYQEAHQYRTGIVGSEESTRIGVPTAENDLKYHYTQGMAVTYLLSGDERLRERVEDVAVRASSLWNPVYTPGGSFWTERHAAFALLAYVWAARISVDRRDEFLVLADEAVDAYRDTQAAYPAEYTRDDARCLSHGASDAGETYGYEGCSPWLSAILADGLAEYAAERGGERASRAREAIVKLGRFFAEFGADPDGKPYYWLSGDGTRGERDPFHEHWGEMPYIIAMAWHYDGRRDDWMREVAEAFVDGLALHGEASQIRSFNWQCRSAPLTPFYLE